MKVVDFPFQASFQLINVEDDAAEKVLYRVMRPGGDAPLLLAHYRWTESFPFERRAEALADWKNRLARLSASNLSCVPKIEEYGDNLGRPYVAVREFEGQSAADILTQEESVHFGEFKAFAANLIEAALGLLRENIPAPLLTPLNIFLPSGGGLLLSIEDLYDQELDSSAAASLKRHYAPPNRAGKNLDALDFVWAIGVILYQMRYRRHPFAGLDGAEGRAGILWPAGEPSSLKTRAFFSRALHPERGQRFRSLEEMKRAVESLDFSPDPISRVSVRTIAAGAALAALILFAGWFAFTRISLPAPKKKGPQKVAVVTPSVEQLIGDADGALGAGLTEPDFLDDGADSDGTGELTIVPAADAASKSAGDAMRAASQEETLQKSNAGKAAAPALSPAKATGPAKEPLPEPATVEVVEKPAAPTACAMGGRVVIELPVDSQVFVDGVATRHSDGSARFDCMKPGIRHIRVAGVTAPLLRSFDLPVDPGSRQTVVISEKNPNIRLTVHRD